MLGHDTTAGRSRRRDLGPAGRRRPRRIYPGDKIYYYSPAFVVGDTRALREAVVVRIDPDEDAEFPILINSVEILPLRTVLKPILSSDGGELSEKWLHLKYYELVKGTYEIPSREQELSAGLRRAVDGVFAAVRAGGNGAGTTDRVIIPEVESENSAEDHHEDNGGNVRDRGMSYDAETGVAAEEKHEANEDQRELVDCFTDSLTRAQNLAAFDKLWTPTFREKKNHRGKDRLGIRKTSRKRGHRKQRKPSRKSQAVYHANTTQSAFLSKFMKLPQVRQALLARRNQEPESDGTGPDVVRTVQGSGQPVYTEVTDVTSSLRVLRAPLHAPKSPNEDPKKNVKWPGDVFEIRGQRNPSGIKFSDIGDLGKCSCLGECYAFQCLNSLSDTYCTRSNCALGGQCGNSTRRLGHLSLFETEHSGLGVFTTRSIECGVNIAEYCGELEAYEGIDQKNKAYIPLKQNTGYSLLLVTRAVRRHENFVYIEPVKYGSIGRFVNHSCEPNCEFREVLYRSQVRIDRYRDNA